MPIDHRSQWTPTLQSAKKTSAHLTDTSLTSKAAPRRIGHGGNAWSLPFGSLQRQPQDGAIDLVKSLTSISARIHHSLPQEPEDARLTGGTRSLSRRVLGLNVTKAPRAVDLHLVDLHLTAQVA